jgi:tetratricopeptide (TPR) repeat protein
MKLSIIATSVATTILVGLSFPIQMMADPSNVSIKVTSTATDVMLGQDRTWENVAWTGENRPFASARTLIDRVASGGTNLERLTAIYRTAAEADPSNALKQFRWAYACQKLGNISHPTMRDSTPVLLALVSANQPNTYDYARIRLMFTYSGPKDRALFERLLAFAPDDPQLESMYAYVLSQSKSPSDYEKAMQIEKNLITRGQYMPTVYRDLADIYYDIGWNLHDISYYQKSIDNSKLFLSLIPTSDWRRAAAEHSIAYLTKRVAEKQL